MRPLPLLPAQIGASDGLSSLPLKRNKLDITFPLAGLGDVIAVLHPHQRIHGHAKCFLDPERHHRREMYPLIEQRGQRRTRDCLSADGAGNRASSCPQRQSACFFRMLWWSCQ